ncbi:hypothetical protein NQ314_011769 [Rhamnusium bicolor]|uniref:Pre-rRNA-processing protein RIX1 N-terminal domain-containing protein n=1 Tax=Rhamnusium bicolor TaxID=1586634 RepID=A0AAV8XGB9_9CUCU|nr:hypothetical protein NQ314_011769 [Rhamnusium bicolor]
MSLNSTQIEDAFTTTDEDIRMLLSNILNLNLENDSNQMVIISTINKLLSTSRNRLQGLDFLNLIINNCSSRVISENAFTWISHCLVKYSGDNLKEIKLVTIGKIVENVYNEQEFTKRFISDYISKVLENCLSAHINSHESEAALETLSICMKHYGSWFSTHKTKIESYLLTFLENSSEKLVEKAAAAFHYLQQIGGAGVDGINHKTNFSTNFQKLCATVQKLFDKFLENQTEIEHSDRSNQEGFEFIDLPHYSQKMLHITARRIRNCLKFIMTMLLKSFPVAKEIIPIHLLDIINRGTAIHQCLSMGNEKSLEDFQFSLLLNKIQVQLLQLLRIFIVWGQANLLPFSFIISKIQIDCLNKSQNCQCFKTDCLFQEVVYKVLGCWLRISKNAVHAHFQTQLVTCILKDITPVTNSVTLSHFREIVSARLPFVSSEIFMTKEVVQEPETIFDDQVLGELNNQTECRSKETNEEEAVDIESTVDTNQDETNALEESNIMPEALLAEKIYYSYRCSSN